MQKPLILGGTLIEPGQIREVHLPLTEASNSRPVLLPITVIRGVEEGLTVVLTAAVHGDELNGTAILRNLMAKIPPDKLRGTLIIAPIVNVMGFLSRSRYLPDRRDLNRFFPGYPNGNMAQRIAYRIFEDVVRRADVGIDFHTAADGRENYPHLRADMSNPAVRKFTKAFGASIIVDNPPRPGTLRYAATQKGIPFFVFEGGTADAFQKPIVHAGVDGILTFLFRTKMLPRRGKKRKPSFQIIVRKTQWVRAERGGLLELKIHPGKLLYRGDPVANIANPLGRDVHHLPSPLTGLVLSITTSPVVNPGTPVAHVAKLQKTLATVEKANSRGLL